MLNSINKNYSLFVGIDPGLSGCMVSILVSEKGNEILNFFKLPVYNDGNRRHIDPIKFSKMLRDISVEILKEETLIVLERAQPMPRDGSVGAFRYGETYGILKGIISCKECKCITVPPVTWKKLFFGKNKTTKDDSRNMAIKLFPEYSDKFKKKNAHNMAEATLLAKYGMSMFKNI